MLNLRPATRHTVAAIVLVAVVIVPAGCGTGSLRATEKNDQSATAATSRSVTDNIDREVVAADVVAVVDEPEQRAKRPPLRPGAKTVALARAGGRSYDKTFDDLRFDIEPGQRFHREMLPESIEAMAGQRIRVRGYMLPTSQKRGIKEFVLVRDNQECCFGPGAALYDCILVHMKPSSSAEYSVRPVAVEGVFDIDEVRAGDLQLAIYRLDADSVK